MVIADSLRPQAGEAVVSLSSSSARPPPFSGGGRSPTQAALLKISYSYFPLFLLQLFIRSTYWPYLQDLSVLLNFYSAFVLTKSLCDLLIVERPRQPGREFPHTSRRSPVATAQGNMGPCVECRQLIQKGQAYVACTACLNDDRSYLLHSESCAEAHLKKNPKHALGRSVTVTAYKPRTG